MPSTAVDRGDAAGPAADGDAGDVMETGELGELADMTTYSGHDQPTAMNAHRQLRQRPIVIAYKERLYLNQEDKRVARTHARRKYRFGYCNAQISDWLKQYTR